jgi:cyclophilin family peptidyl-prolyl cis-trans isomerase
MKKKICYLATLVLLVIVLCNKTKAEESAKKELKQLLEQSKINLQGKKSSLISEANLIASETKTETIKKTEEIITMKSEEIQEVKKEKSAQESFVMMETDKGSFKIKLFMEEAPITAANFKDLVERKFYNGLIFHRIIPGFVIQGGCPLGNGTGNFVDPETKKSRYIKHDNAVGKKHDKAGIVAMARTSDPDSASSQFFIDLAPLPSLNPGGVDPYGYAIFGEVVEGLDVVMKIAKENVPPYPGSDGTANPVKILSATIVE